MVPERWPGSRQTGDKARCFQPAQATRLSRQTTMSFNPREATMQYKTIIYEMLQQRPQMHEQLRKSRKLLPTLERYARELKTSHEAWKEMLGQMRPGSQKSQIASEALEMALKEMEDHLPSALSQDGNEAQVLDAAMLFLRRPTSRG
jgi:hypothetical protein